MMNNTSWNEFCELYFETAKKYARTHLKRITARNGELDRHIDEDYVIDAAVLTALEKTYAHFDSSRGAKITTFLSNVVHNELVDEIKKESRVAGNLKDIEDVKTLIKALAEEASPYPPEDPSSVLIPMLTAAIERLSPSDQVILNYYLEDKSSYTEKSAEKLHVTKNYVNGRCFKILKKLPSLMGVTRDFYLECTDEDFELEIPAFSGYLSETEEVTYSRDIVPKSVILRKHPANFIDSSLSIRHLAERLLEELM